MSRRRKSSSTRPASTRRGAPPRRLKQSQRYSSQRRGRGRAGAKRAKERKLAIGIFGFVAAAVIGFFVFSLSRPAPLQMGEDLCPLSEEDVVGHTIVLIDATDNLAEDENNLRKMLDSFINERLQKNERLSLSVLGGKDYSVKEKISLCRPLHPDDGNALTQSLRDLRQTFNRKFNAPLTAQLDNIADVESSRYSPLIETLDKIAGNYNFVKRTTGKRIIIVSDMLQNTTDMNQFRDKSKFSDFKETPYYKSIKPDLKNTEIVVFYIKRSNYRLHQTREHREFWRALLEDSGANSISYDPPIQD